MECRQKKNFQSLFTKDKKREKNRNNLDEFLNSRQHCILHYILIILYYGEFQCVAKYLDVKIKAL